jgi:hypothetical protein
MAPFFKRGPLKQPEPIVGCIPDNSGLPNPQSAIRNPQSKRNVLSWTLNRLRLMPLPEIGLRLYRKLRVKVWKMLLPFVQRRPFVDSLASTESQRDWLGELKTHFPITLGKNFWERYVQVFEARQVETVGENLLRGKIPVFEWTYETGGGIPDWHRDVLSPVPWPKIFTDQLNHNDLRYGRVINVWELNRHFYFYDLGKAFHLTKDTRFGQTLLAHLESWIDQNPLGIGINWYSPMENGLRLVSWLWGLFFISEEADSSQDHSLALSPERRQKILTSITWQAYFIEKNLSKYSSANNHLVGEALGLFWVGALLPSLRRAEKWKQKGWTILCREIEKQVFPDGVPREQSTRYLFFLFDLYTLAILLAQKQGLTIPPVLWNRLEKICEYIMTQMDEGGNLPDLGDSSDGLACKLYSTALHPYRSLLTTGAVWFERGDFKHWGGQIDERNFWLWGEEGLLRYQKIEEDSSERGSRIFPQGGQVILRKGRGSEEAVLSFDAGSFGFLSIAAHAHADALSFSLSLGGRPILIDPGTYLYHDGGKWRRYFRGTRAHNTVEVDGLDQGLSGGPFMWLSQPETTVGQVSLGPERSFIQGLHKGYERLAFPLKHERSILWEQRERSWTIQDRLETQGLHSILVVFHFYPHCRVQFRESGLFEVSIEEPVMTLKLDPRLRPVLYQGEEDPVWGWVSPNFGVKIPTVTLVGKMMIQKTEIVQTVLRRS